MPPSQNPQKHPSANSASGSGRKLWSFILTAAAFFLIGVIGAFGYTYSRPSQSPEINNVQNIGSFDLENEQWDISRIPAQLPGAPAFTISYPTHFGMPHVSVEILNLSGIDFDNNVGKINFYKSSWGPDEVDFFLRGFFVVAKLEQGQTLTDFVNTQLLPTAVDKVQYVVDGRPVVAQRASPDVPMTSYYIEFKDGLVLNLNWAQNRHEVDPEEGRLLQDKIIKSIKFVD